ncbi:MAG: response regulator [Nitriliruptoraceae bacterium]
MKRRVLLVDDDPVLREVLSTVLDLEEFAVTTAVDGEQALTLVAEEPPEVVVCDVDMPGIDGFEVCRRLRADPAASQLPVVLLTAHGGPAEQRQGVEAGCSALLTKPFSPLELIELLRGCTTSVGEHR